LVIDFKKAGAVGVALRGHPRYQERLDCHSVFCQAQSTQQANYGY